MVLELYLDLLSQPCRAVYIFAKKNNIPFMMKPVEMLKGSGGAGGRRSPVAPLFSCPPIFSRLPPPSPETGARSSRSPLPVSVGQVVIPLFIGHQVSPEKLHEAMEELNHTIQKLEDKFLQEKPFLIGPEISLADLVAIVELMQPFGASCDILEGHPKLQEWRKRVELTLGKELFMEAHNRILNPQELKSIVIDPPLKAQMKPLLLKMLK
uniref:GST C-terminal domain-containing protein n=1 Tax=Pseudonaja textilis TaxID=8673 RepID=A0A670ZVX3_PSETE